MRTNRKDEVMTTLRDAPVGAVFIDRDDDLWTRIVTGARIDFVGPTSCHEMPPVCWPECDIDQAEREYGPMRPACPACRKAVDDCGCAK